HDTTSMTITTNSLRTATPIYDADQITPGSCDNRYTISRTYHATDSCGNSSSRSQTITVDDEIAPVINTYPADTTVSCSSAVAPADNNRTTETHNCKGTVTSPH